MIHEMPSPFAEGEDLEPEVFPELNTISAAFFYQYLPIPTAPLSPPEYVYVPIASNKKGLKLQGMLATWNSAWEAGPLRHNLFDTRASCLEPCGTSSGIPSAISSSCRWREIRGIPDPRRCTISSRWQPSADSTYLPSSARPGRRFTTGASAGAGNCRGISSRDSVRRSRTTCGLS